MPDTPQWVWLNGRIMPMAEATIGIDDRGFQFADGVYEVIRLYNSTPFALGEHLQRLGRSAEGIQMTLPLPPQLLMAQIHELVARSEVREGIIYLQLTRGSAPRNHLIPANPQHTLLFYCRPYPASELPGSGDGLKLITVADDRWQRCWIKSIALLPNVLAKSTAHHQAADEAVFTEHGYISECSVSNLLIVKNDELLTAPIGPKVLPGITRQLILGLARQLGISVGERPIELTEAMGADEIFITSTTREINWVRQWDGRAVGGGTCGPMTRRLHQALRAQITRECGPDHPSPAITNADPTPAPAHRQAASA